MTNMKRLSVTFPKELAVRLDALKHTGYYAPRSYAEMVRDLVRAGLRAADDPTE